MLHSRIGKEANLRVSAISRMQRLASGGPLLELDSPSLRDILLGRRGSSTLVREPAG